MPYVCGIARWSELARGVITGDRDGILKLLVSSEDRRILGVHVLGTSATDLVHIGQAVMAAGAGGLDFLVTAVFNYPTFAESYKVAALDAANRIRAMQLRRSGGGAAAAAGGGPAGFDALSAPAARLARGAGGLLGVGRGLRVDLVVRVGAGAAAATSGPRRRAKRSARPPSACENSDGITKILFALPCASCGSICRYW